MDTFEMIISNPQGGNFLRRIDWNKEEFAKQVREIAERYSGELQISSAEDKKKAKEDRAILNKIKNEIEARRKAIKAAVMEPYDIFESEVKEGTAELDKVTKSIDQQIKTYEEREKQEKIAQIRDYWENHEKRPGSRGPLQALTSWERIKSPEWSKASYSVKKACADIDAAFERALSDLQSIESIDDDRVIKDIMKDKLVETGSLQAAYETQARIHRQDQLRREKEEREERMRLEAEEKRDRARREAEEAAHREQIQRSAADKMEALRARLGGQKQPDTARRMNNAEQPENAAGAAESNEAMPLAGNVRERGPVGSPENQSAVSNDAQGDAGQDQGTAQKEKIYKASFWVAGTVDQLRALGDYIKDIGFVGYGTIKNV